MLPLRGTAAQDLASCLLDHCPDAQGSKDGWHCSKGHSAVPGEVCATVVPCRGAVSLALGEWCGLTSHAGLGERPLCQAGGSAKPAEMDAGAILPEVSVRLGAKCGVGCEMCILAHKVKKRRQVELQRMNLISSAREPGYAGSTLGLDVQL